MDLRLRALEAALNIIQWSSEEDATAAGLAGAVVGAAATIEGYLRQPLPETPTVWADDPADVDFYHLRTGVPVPDASRSPGVYDMWPLDVPGGEHG